MKKIIVLMTALMMLCAFPVHARAQEDEGLYSIEMHRLYNPNSGEHFYTGNAGEKDALVKLGWIYEKVGWIAPSKSETPVYRLYNANAGDHHYTMNAGERDALVKAGWTYEKIGWYSDDDMIQPLYRQYNPNAQAGSHNYTTNKAENDALVKMGWKEEGIAWWGSYPGALEFDEFYVANTRIVTPKDVKAVESTDKLIGFEAYIYSEEKDVWSVLMRVIPRHSLSVLYPALKSDASLSEVLTTMRNETAYDITEVSPKKDFVRQTYSWRGTFDYRNVEGAFEKDGTIYIVTYTVEDFENDVNEPILNQCLAYFLFTD